MVEWIVPPCAGLIEPSIAPEYYAECIGGIELLSGCVRTHWVCEQMPLEAGGLVLPSKPVVVKIVCPIITVPGLIGHLVQCLWRPNVDSPPLQPPRGNRPHLV